MKPLLIFSAIVSFYIIIGKSETQIVFRSEGVEALNLKNSDKTEWIFDDNFNEVEIELLEGKDGLIYWRRRLITPVCLTGECKLINVGIYWKFNGNFLGIDVYDEHLTKSDHSIFTSLDYQKLLQILEDDWSILREYEYDELITDQINDIDGITRATSKEIASRSVRNAVYTTFTLYHLIHNGERPQIIGHTLKHLNKTDLFKKKSYSQQIEFCYFILEQFNLGNLSLSDEIKDLVLFGIRSPDDKYLMGLCFKAVSSIASEDLSFQEDLSEIYAGSNHEEKIRLMQTLNQLKDVSPGLYNTLATDLELENLWLSLKILSVLKNSKCHSELVLGFVRMNAIRENEYFDDVVNKILLSDPTSGDLNLKH